MKYKKVIDYEFIVIYEFSGEDVIVGHIFLDNTNEPTFVYNDLLFKSETKLTNNSLSYLQDQISDYYSSRDTIGLIENEFPFHLK